MTKRIEIDDSQRSLIQICFEIARDRFKKNAATIANSRVCEQFERQAAQTEELIMMFSEADAITVTTAAQ